MEMKIPTFRRREIEERWREGEAEENSSWAQQAQSAKKWAD